MALQQVSGDRTTWINIMRPTPKDVEVLRRIYPYIHLLNLEVVASSIERPKIDDSSAYLFIFDSDDRRIIREIAFWLLACFMPLFFRRRGWL